MKVVNQTTGIDLDPANVQTTYSSSVCCFVVCQCLTSLVTLSSLSSWFSFVFYLCLCFLSVFVISSRSSSSTEFPEHTGTNYL